MAWITIYSVICLGGVVLGHAVWDLASHPADPKWLILAALSVGTGWIMLRIPKTEISFSISDTFNIAAAVLFGPSAGAVTAALDGLVLSAQFDRPYRTAYRILFNVATSAISIWLAAHLFFALAGRIALSSSWTAVRLMALLALFGTVNYLVNTGLVALAIALERQLPVYRIWRDHFLGLWVTYFGGVLATLPLVMVSLLRPLGAIEILVLIIPLPIILQTTFRHALGRVQDQVSHLGQVNRVYVAVIETLATAIDAKDQVTHDHIRRVQTEALRLAKRLGVHEDAQLQAIMAAALLHDVGKISVPEHILNKPGRLSASEFEVMKKHAPAGAEILSVVGFPYPVVPIVRHHHENWDGSGYPDGIAGDAIPIGARIISVVDCFDALTSDRPYRPRLDTATALEMIGARRGTMYDPRIVDTFLTMHEPTADARAPVGAARTEPDASSAAVMAAEALPVPRAADRVLLDLQAICDLAMALGASTSDRDSGETLWLNLQSRTPATALALYRYDQASDTIACVHAAGDAHALVDARIPVGERLSGWVAATQQGIMNSDARLDLDGTHRERSPLRSALAVPIVTDDRITGVLSLYAPFENAFDEDHRRLAQAAAYAATSLSRNSA
ncbi:MAG TPA: HD domain-containing phosphohydrolase [Gemmatimonadaceae bacterium]|jgi:putative nucleotidyltransferase with HDIG domain|nr:HD domain-containing phosphohydrolase [Gemmatimonadaceae bacterium]